MTSQRALLSWVGVAVFGCGLATRAFGGETAEEALRKEFAKTYAAPKPAERIAAINKLAGCHEKATLDMLVKVPPVERDKDVRIAVAQTIARWTDTDGSVTYTLVNLYQSERDKDALAGMAATLTGVPLKHDALVTLVRTLLNVMRYPELADNNSRGQGNVNVTKINETINKSRTQFSEVLNAINGLSGQSFTASTKAHSEVQRWWAAHEADFLKADADTMQKMRAAADAKKKAEGDAKKAEAGTKAQP